MIIKEFGTGNRNVIILLHGGGLSWWNYKEEICLLENDYHIVVPILDGHSNSDRRFVSIEDNANEIISLINERFNKNVKLICGLSLGGQILLEILSKCNNICDYAIVESALVFPIPLTYKMIEPSISMFYGLISKKWFSKLQFKSLKIRKDLFEDYYKDTCNISKSDLISFLKANLNYKIKKELTYNNAKTLVLVGSREKSVIKKSANVIKNIIPNSRLEILKGYYHGEFSINDANKYVEKVKELIE